MSSNFDNKDLKHAVSIVILNWNRSDLSRTALEAVMKNTNMEVEVVLVDNGSSLNELRRLRKVANKFPRVKIHEIGVNRFFGKGNNIGAEIASGDILVFLNNDVCVTEGWLEPLVSRLTSSADVGAVGPMFLYPDGRLQEAGAMVDAEGRAIQLGKFQEASDLRFSVPRTVDYVSAACIAIRRFDFFLAGGFDYAFEPAYYEDTSLCFALQKLGKSVIYEPSSRVIHIESATTSDSSNGLGLRSVVEINRLKFIDKWSSDDSFEAIDYGFGHEEIVSTSRQAAVYTPYALQQGGGEKYILSVAETLLASGYEVTLVTPHQYSTLRLLQLARDFRLNLSGLQPMTLNLALKKHFDLVIMMGNEITPPTALRGSRNIFHCQFPFQSAGEFAGSYGLLKDIDLIVVNSEYTKEHVERKLRASSFQPPVKVIYPPVHEISAETVKRDELRITTIGRFTQGGHQKRHDILIETFKELTYEFPSASLNVLGGLSSDPSDREYLLDLMKISKGFNVHFGINISQKKLEHNLQSSGIYWHATGLGVDVQTNPEKCEHFGISIVEAMSAGAVPFAVGSGGACEIIDFGENGFFYHHPKSLLRRTRLLLSLEDTERWNIRQSAVKKAKLFGVSHFASSWRELVC